VSVGVAWGGSVSATAAPVVIPRLESPNFEARSIGYWRRQYRRRGYSGPYAYYPPAFDYYGPPPVHVYPPAYGYHEPPPAEGGYTAGEGDYGDYPPTNGDYGDYPPENGY
jgi:hypothetical protein